MVSDSPDFATDRDESEADITEILKYKALAYGFVALIFGLLSIVTILIPDPILFIDEVVAVLVTVFSSQKALKGLK